MAFEIGKYYKHTSGHMIHCVFLSSGHFDYFPDAIIAETGAGELIAIGRNDIHAMDYKEVSKDEWIRVLDVARGGG